MGGNKSLFSKMYPASKIRYLLSALFIALAFMQSSNVFASSAASSYTFGNNQPLDQASVSVMRLVVTYSTTTGGGCTTASTGLGIIVGSWPTTAGSTDFTNWIMTDGSLIDPQGVLCGTGKPTAALSTIQIYVNDAYTNASGSSTNSLLKRLTCTPLGCTDGSASASIMCQVSAPCSNGIVLVPFHTTTPQPFIDVARADQTTPYPFGVGLASPAPSTTTPTPAQAAQLLTPVQIINIAYYKNELGMPIVNALGQLLDMTTKANDTGGSIRSFVTSQLSPGPVGQGGHTNSLRDSWNKGITAYYAGNYVNAQTDFRNAGTHNNLFRANVAFWTLATAKAGNGGTGANGRGTPTTSKTPGPNQTPAHNSVTFFGYFISDSLFTALVIGALMLLIIILALITFTVVRRQAQQRKEFAELNRGAEVDAARIAQQQVAQQEKAWIPRQPIQEQKVAEKPQQPPPPLVTHTMPIVNVVQETSIPPHVGPADPLCPRCQQSIPANAVFCASCGFSLSPAVALQTQAMAMPASNVNSFIPPSLDAAQPPRDLVHEQVQDDRQGNRQQERVSSRLGQRLGNYQIISLLGEGGFAEVYLGEHIHLGSQAAIKVLHSQLARDERERFLAEARTLVRLVHPHIVRVLDFGIEEKTPFLVMDVAIDGTLRQRHPKGTRLSHSTVNSYVQQVADALQFAHDQRIIHRDIKPENMLIGRQNTIVLSDFGIATVAQSSRYQSVQDMAGTIAYMSPEQIQSHPRPASDQYALGVVVYEWLCGTRPFQGSFTEIAVKHAMVPPPPLRKYVPTLPTAVEEVVLKALAKDPKDRFVNVQAFAQALAQAR